VLSANGITGPEFSSGIESHANDRIVDRERRMKRIFDRRVLVTGGAGFLGSYLCEHLLRKGCHVTCLDNLFTGSKKNIEHMLGDPNFEFMQHDVTNPIYLQVDEIYNLACPASPVHYQFDPIHTTKTCVLGAINVLGLARRVKAKVLQASTSEVYGDPLVHPQHEDYWGHVHTTGVRSCYDEGKRCAESLFFDYHRAHAIQIKVARIFNTYGPRMHEMDGRVVSNFINQALRGDPITIYGDGSQTRSFCYVDDLVNGLMRLMESPDEFTGPVNLGNPMEFTIGELANCVLALTGSKSEIRNLPLPPDDPKQRRPDIALARDALGWAPKIMLERGLPPTIEYFEALQKGQSRSQPRKGTVTKLVPGSLAAQN
jgi:UDP-glucuronate decarboxylase